MKHITSLFTIGILAAFASSSAKAQLTSSCTAALTADKPKYQYVLSIVPYQFPVQYIPMRVPIEGNFTARFDNGALSPAATFFPVVSVSLSWGMQGLSVISAPEAFVTSTPITLPANSFAILPNGAFSPLSAQSPPAGTGSFLAQCGIAVFASISGTVLVPVGGASSSAVDGHSVWMIGGTPPFGG